MGSGSTIPINYQYEFSAWIYKTLHFGNPEFTVWLHDKGYTRGKRSFKLFTFSNLEVGRFKVFKDRFKILSNEVQLVLTFHIEEAVQHFITGLFQNRTLSIGDRKSNVDFSVKSVETLEKPEFFNHMEFITLSPICVSKPTDKENGLGTTYLNPEHPEYQHRFFENLINRYKAVHPASDGKFEDESDFQLKLKNNPKSRLIKIKADTPQQTRIRGYMYDFECKAPAELLQFGYEAGLGEKNSLGFGCVGVR